MESFGRCKCWQQHYHSEKACFHGDAFYTLPGYQPLAIPRFPLADASIDVRFSISQHCAGDPLFSCRCAWFEHLALGMILGMIHPLTAHRTKLKG
jgi:hypothetical protein